MEDEWLESFIQDYRRKLAGEKLELEERKPTEPSSRRSTEPPIALTYNIRQTHPAAVDVEDEADSFFFRHCSKAAQRSREEERAERRRKQDDYRRCLDQQLVELRQRRECERKAYRQAPDPDDSKIPAGNPLKCAGSGVDDPPRRAVRSSSPPITSHYRSSYSRTKTTATQTVVIPRPFSSVSTRLSDLTELRQLYSNR